MAYVSPFDVSLVYTLSICSISPVRTILAPSPALAMIVFTSCTVKFCASSMIMNAFEIDLPRYIQRFKFNGSRLHQLLKCHLVVTHDELYVVLNRLEPKQHLLFHSTRQNQYPSHRLHRRETPLCITKESESSSENSSYLKELKHFSYSVHTFCKIYSCCIPAAMAHSVLPIACPVKVTKWMSGSVSKSNANVCSLFLGSTPHVKLFLQSKVLNTGVS